MTMVAVIVLVIDPSRYCVFGSGRGCSPAASNCSSARSRTTASAREGTRPADWARAAISCTRRPVSGSSDTVSLPNEGQLSVQLPGDDMATRFSVIAERAETCHDRCVEAVLWIVLAVALAIGEAFTVTFLVIMFSVGALAAAGVAALGAPLLLQVLVFAVVSGLSVAALRPIIVKHARTALESGDTPFGIEAIEGTHATVLEEVDGQHGMIKIDGELWQARSFDGDEKYLPGERVRVVKVQGATVIVWRDDLPDI